MSKEQAAPTSMYCRQCGYQLTGLSESRCPECGRAFDPANGQSYLHRRHSWIVRRWCRRIGVATAATVLLVLLGVGSLWGYVYWRYHADWLAEQKAIASLKQGGVDIWSGDPDHPGRHTVRLPCDPYLAWLTRPLSYLRDRVAYVDLDVEDKELTHADFASLTVFKHLQEVDVGTILVTDGQMAELSDCLKDMTQLRTLLILSHYGGMTDAGLAHLGRLTQLTRLSVWGPKITGQGLAHLHALTNLGRLNLTLTQIGDDDLDVLKAFPAMTYLGLIGARLTDVGLEQLKGLKSLRDLDLRDTRVTRQGVESLQRALPGVRILWSEDRRPDTDEK
jgi:hypothetical protein